MTTTPVHTNYLSVPADYDTRPTVGEWAVRIDGDRVPVETFVAEAVHFDQPDVLGTTLSTRLPNGTMVLDPVSDRVGWVGGGTSFVIGWVQGTPRTTVEFTYASHMIPLVDMDPPTYTEALVTRGEHYSAMTTGNMAPEIMPLVNGEALVLITAMRHSRHEDMVGTIQPINREYWSGDDTGHYTTLAGDHVYGTPANLETSSGTWRLAVAWDEDGSNTVLAEGEVFMAGDIPILHRGFDPATGDPVPIQRVSVTFRAEQTRREYRAHPLDTPPVAEAKRKARKARFDHRLRILRLTLEAAERDWIDDMVTLARRCDEYEIPARHTSAKIKAVLVGPSDAVTDMREVRLVHRHVPTGYVSDDNPRTEPERITHTAENALIRAGEVPDGMDIIAVEALDRFHAYIH